ncbi:MAG: hypothetical protein EOP53_23440 [Sphingobacteriales bacterium]|nr:MAG: hypothetical protein EOP53_23440 [Sphingobacteriales bacterium]
MKTIILSTLLMFATSAFCQKASYDSVLAKKLGADAYGMKQYVMVVLTTGKADIKEKATRDSLFAGHMKNIQRLADEGKLAVAGPFGKNDISYRGLFIFNTASVEEAKKWVDTDPTVIAGIFEAIYVPWYGSAAMMEVNSIHERVQKVSF